MAYQELNDLNLIKKVIQSLSNKKRLMMLFLKTFEMCQTGDFNCLHVSLVSNEALALLRNLPISDPALYKKLTYQQEPVLGKEEPAFTDEVEEFTMDDIDIPTNILIDHLLSDGAALEDGYAVDERGCVVRNNLAEHVDDVHEEDAAAAAAPILLGRGCRKKMKPALYGGSDMWDT